MAYRVLVNGIPIEVDSPSEAIALAQQAGLSKVNGAETKPVSHKRAASSTANLNAEWAAFLGLVKDKEQQCRVLEIIKNHREGVTGRQIADSLNLDKTIEATGIINGGILKNVVKAGFSEASVIRYQRVDGEMTYFPGPILEEKEIP